MSPANNSHRSNWRNKVFEVIYHADTPAGKWFDILLIVFILFSVFVVILDSVPSINANFGPLLFQLEWFFTIVFTIEYLLRIISIRQPVRYIFSFFGIIDLLSILPTYLALYFVGAQNLLVIRILRILRIFRVLKLVRYTSQSRLLVRALIASRRKIVVFFLFIFSVLVICGSLMYVIEGPDNGFSSIPASIYWAVVTITTVGYGDITPQTLLGRFLATIMMLIGFSIIAVPTGIFTAELNNTMKQVKRSMQRVCKTCHLQGHTKNAIYCRRCGEKL